MCAVWSWFIQKRCGKLFAYFPNKPGNNRLGEDYWNLSVNSYFWEENDKKYFLLSDYNNEGKRVSHWFVDGVETYHRNMSSLVNGLIDAGFKLEKMVESYATEDIIKIKPKYNEQRDHSYYVYFKAQK